MRVVRGGSCVKLCLEECFVTVKRFWTRHLDLDHVSHAATAGSGENGALFGRGKFESYLMFSFPL